MLALLLAVLAQAGPDFTRSEFAGPAQARERDVVEYVLTVRNTGDAPSGYLEAVVALPRLALRVSGDLPYAADDRAFQGPLSLAPGEEKVLRFRAVAAVGSYGTLLSPMATIRAVPGGTVLHASTEIGARREPNELMSVGGGLALTRVGAQVLAFLVAVPLFMIGALVWAWRGGRKPPLLAVLRSAFGVMVSVGFLLIFVGLAFEDLRLLRDYREASCEVLDSSARISTEQTRRGDTQATFAPVLAVRFKDDGEERIGTGFDGPSRLRIGGGAALEKELAGLQIGRPVTCWYDPADPARIVVKRGFGGAYLFALLPLGLLALTLGMLRAAARG